MPRDPPQKAPSPCTGLAQHPGRREGRGPQEPKITKSLLGCTAAGSPVPRTRPDSAHAPPRCEFGGILQTLPRLQSHPAAGCDASAEAGICTEPGAVVVWDFFFFFPSFLQGRIRSHAPSSSALQPRLCHHLGGHKAQPPLILTPGFQRAEPPAPVLLRCRFGVPLGPSGTSDSSRLPAEPVPPHQPCSASLPGLGRPRGAPPGPRPGAPRPPQPRPTPASAPGALPGAPAPAAAPSGVEKAAAAARFSPTFAPVSLPAVLGTHLGYISSH